MNNTHVTTARAYADAAGEWMESLKAEYGKAPHQRDQATIAACHQGINYGLKSAEVHALIGIGQQLGHLLKVAKTSAVLA